MARFMRFETLKAIYKQKMIPIFNIKDPEKGKKIIKACYDGGSRIAEFTNRGDMSIEVYKELELYARKEMPDLILGIGSVSDQATAALYMQYGANFVVSQYFDELTCRICNKRKIPYIPGCGTVTEIHRAEEFGVEICKIFPAAQIGGPAFIKSVLAPSPWSCLLPTGGVSTDEENLKNWFNAGAVCVGMGSKLIPAKISDNFDYSQISKNIKQSLEIIKKCTKQ